MKDRGVAPTVDQVSSVCAAVCISKISPCVSRLANLFSNGSYLGVIPLSMFTQVHD